MITIQSLIAAGAGPVQARAFATPLAVACQRFGITTPERAGAFVGQLLIESAGLTRLEEGLYYTTQARLVAVYGRRVAGRDGLLRNAKALANVVYADRLGNGGPESGHGWVYRGRGLIQLTGLDNYTRAALALGRNYVTQPELVALPADAALTAAWFWSSNGCNALADAGNHAGCTRRINGPAMLHAAERERAARRAIRAFEPVTA